MSAERALSADRIVRGIRNFYRRVVLRDRPLLEARRWFADGGDARRTMDYPLGPSDVVVDVGGYIGDFAQAVYDRFGSMVHLYEPMPKFYRRCVGRFAANPKVHCHGFGLGATPGWFALSDDGLASNLFSGGGGEQVEIRSAVEALAGLERISLIKLNVEGSEYDILPALLAAGFADRIDAFQIQFHTVGDDYRERRDAIRATLAQTHVERWCYYFVWESWERRRPLLADAAGT